MKMGRKHCDDDGDDDDDDRLIDFGDELRTD
jgi:hypothetical protein